MTEPDFSAALMAAAEEIKPWYEFAEGQKAELIRRGWSAASAETAATEILVCLIRKWAGA